METPRPLTVLIVEDERIVARDLQETLTGMGYDAYAIASSSDEALAVARARPPDLVLMDIRIKGGRDGIETAEILRDELGVPVVYLTAHADAATLERAKSTQPYAYLLKPVRQAELRSVIEVSSYRHRAEQRVRERERWLAVALSSIGDAVVAVDLSGRVTFMNPAAEALTGRRLADTLGHHAHEVLALEDRGGRHNPLGEALSERRTVKHDASLSRDTGSSRIVSESAAPVLDRDELLGAVMVLRDVTEERRVEKQHELFDRLASLATLAGGVAHEVNNPLTVVIANSTLVEEHLRRLRDDCERGRGLGTAQLVARMDGVIDAHRDMLASARRIAKLVSDLQAFARPEHPAGAQTDVAGVVRWAARRIGPLLRRRARMVIEVPAELRVALDESGLRQIVSQLMSNAALAIPEGDVEGHEVVVAARAGEHDRVILEVRDSGSGMSPQVRERAFEPFFTTREVGEGSGLGLAVCLGIAGAAGGALELESLEGAGTVARLTLPAAPRSRASSSPGTAVRRGRVLLVDDEELVLGVLARILVGHDVVTARTGRRALELIAAGPPFDAVLASATLPDMSGVALHAACREIGAGQARRLAFLTGGGEDPALVEQLVALPNPRVEKPFGLDEIRAVVDELLSLEPEDG